jgi:hypothetical protein
MRIQVKINDNNDTTFNAENGRYAKLWDNDSQDMMSFSYKNEKGFLKALKKMMTPDSIVKAWNEDGTPNKNFKL